MLQSVCTIVKVVLLPGLGMTGRLTNGGKATDGVNIVELLHDVDVETCSRRRAVKRSKVVSDTACESGKPTSLK